MMILGLLAAAQSNAADAEMVTIDFGSGGSVIVTPDHLFLTPGGFLQRADKLTLETLLVDHEGRNVEIKNIRIQEYQGGVHHGA